MTGTPLLEVRNVAAAPWGPPLLSGISFSLLPGESLAVVGPNGAGKSTLLHTLAGGIEPGDGDIRLHGKPLKDLSRMQRARSIAMLPQQSQLGFPFRVSEVVLLGRTPHASGSDVDRRVLTEVLAAADCTALAQRRYTELSGGEQQRVQLARVLAQVWPGANEPPGLLLLDEPTTGLDLEHQQMLQSVLKQLSMRGSATVAVLHDFNLAATLAERILVLRDGHQVCCGPPQEVYTDDMFRRVFRVDVRLIRETGRKTPVVTRP